MKIKSQNRSIIFSNSFSIAWGILIILSATYLSILIPLKIIFSFNTGSFLTTLSFIISLIFLADIFVTYIKRREDSNKEIEDVFSTKKYFLLILFTDFIAFFPFELFTDNSLIQLLRIIKLIKAAFIISQFRQGIIYYTNFSRFTFFIFWLLLSIHWISCGWISLRNSDLNQDAASRYISSLYWTVTTLTTVGYGDVVAVNNEQKLFAILVMIMGVGVYGYIIGNVAGILSKRDPSKTQYLLNLEKLSSLVHFRNIPPALQTKLKNYYKYLWRQKLGYDESSFLENLPVGLRDELSLQLKKDSVEKITLFKNAGEEFIKEIAKHLSPVVLPPNEFIFRAGDDGQEMYFVIHGLLSIIYEDGKNAAELKEGDFFGEIALFKNKKRSASISAVTYCDLYSLSKNSFDYVLTKYPAIAAEIERIVKTREEKEILKNIISD